MKISAPDNHCFALFYKQLSEYIDINDHECILTDTEVVHRIGIILRMRIHDQCILFDRNYNVLCSINRISKKEVVLTILRYEKNKQLSPFIRLYLPLLKRNHLEDAVSFAGQVGVSEIQLITTEKSVHGNVRDDRLDRIMVSACEQAKQYVVPRIYEPISLEDVLDKQHLQQLFACSQEGISFSLFQKGLDIDFGQQLEYGIFIGPEQDFTQREYELFIQKNIPLVSLGSLVLQASVATCLSIALLRSSFFIKK